MALLATKLTVWVLTVPFRTSVAPASMVSVPAPARSSETTSRCEPSVKSATASIVPVLMMLVLPVASSVPLPRMVPPALLIVLAASVPEKYVLLPVWTDKAPPIVRLAVL